MTFNDQIKRTSTLLLSLFFTAAALSGQTGDGGGHGSPSPYVYIKTCFQVLNITEDNLSFSILNNGTSFRINGVPISSLPTYFLIEEWDINGADVYNYNELSDADYSVYNHPTTGDELIEYNKQINGSWAVNNNLFHFDSEVTRIVFTEYRDDPNNPGQLVPGFKTTLNVRNPEDIFEAWRWNGSSSGAPPTEKCLEFNDFLLDVTNDLPGFCSNLSAGDITLTPPTPVGWPSNFSHAVQIKDFQNRTVPTPENYCEDKCSEMEAPPNHPEPVPCGCIEFDLEIILEPCDDANFPCPTLNFTIPLTICCTCDVRKDMGSND